MKRTITAAIFLAFAWQGTALADCPDKEGLKCPTGDVGWVGQCASVSIKGMSCDPCGGHSTHCPPASANDVWKKANSKCRQKIIKSGRVDGCSAPDLPHFKYYKNVFKASCDEHDICYHTTKVSKKDCDGAFLENMKKTCDTFLDGKTTAFTAAGIARADCIRVATEWAAAVSVSGPSTPWGKGYTSDREWAANECQ